AVAPELYARQGDVSKIENIQEIISKVVSKVPDAQVMSDLDAAAAWAVKSSKGTRHAWPSPDFAGEGALCGCTPRTIRSSKPAGRGTGAWKARAPNSRPSTPSNW